MELVWVRVRVEWECFWVNLREDNKVFESKMAVSESNMAEFKMAAIIKVEWECMSEDFFVQNGWIQDGRIQDGCHHQVESEWTSELFCAELSLRIRWLPFLSENAWLTESKMAEFKMAAIIKFQRMRMRQSHSEECFLWIWQKWLNPRWQNSRWLPSSSWVRMNMSEVFLCKMAESKMAEFKMAAIIKLSENEWVKFFCTKWLNPRWQNSRWQPFKIAAINQFEVEQVWVSFLCKMAESKMRIQDEFHQIELVWVRVRVEMRVFLSKSERR